MIFYAIQVNGKKILSLKQYMEEPTSLSLVGLILFAHVNPQHYL